MGCSVDKAGLEGFQGGKRGLHKGPETGAHRGPPWAEEEPARSTKGIHSPTLHPAPIRPKGRARVGAGRWRHGSSCPSGLRNGTSQGPVPPRRSAGNCNRLWGTGISDNGSGGSVADTLVASAKSLLVCLCSISAAEQGRLCPLSLRELLKAATSRPEGVGRSSHGTWASASAFESSQLGGVLHLRPEGLWDANFEGWEEVPGEDPRASGYLGRCWPGNKGHLSHAGPQLCLLPRLELI